MIEEEVICPFNILGVGTICYDGIPSKRINDLNQKRLKCRAWIEGCEVVDDASYYSKHCELLAGKYKFIGDGN